MALATVYKVWRFPELNKILSTLGGESEGFEENVFLIGKGFYDRV